jgi:purine-nucleoside/S-methyl-5'-thioadenosine phosphorylase / adenosine deaminase
MEWITPEWPVPEAIKAISTLRSCGVSTGPYTGMNLADHVGDQPTCVARNRRTLRQRLELPSEPAWLRQVHETRVIQADRAGAGTGADGSFTNRSGIVCAVMTADCLPVLLYERRSGAVAAVHAGWKGLAGGILQQAIVRVVDGDWIAWLGPAIGQGAFEVGDDVRAALLCRSDRVITAFTPNGAHRWLADLYEIARILLRSHGVREIHGGGFCTYTESDRFFSYRRDGVTGRMATLIWVSEDKRQRKGNR